MVKKKKDSMQEYVHQLVKPILNEAMKNTMSVVSHKSNIKIYWRPNNYRLLIPFNKLTFKETLPKRTPSFPMELKICNYGSKHIFKISKSIVIMIDKKTATLIYSLKDDKGKKMWYEINKPSIESVEYHLLLEKERIKDMLLRKLKEIVRCYGGSVDYDKVVWLRYEDGCKGEELLDKLPEDRIIQATSFKKVYSNEMEFKGDKKDIPTQKLINYIDNQALERQSPKILDKLDNIQNERLDFNKAMGLFTDQLKGFGVEIREHRGVVKDIRKYIGIIAGFKPKKIKIKEDQTNLSKFIHNKI